MPQCWTGRLLQQIAPACGRAGHSVCTQTGFDLFHYRADQVMYVANVLLCCCLVLISVPLTVSRKTIPFA